MANDTKKAAAAPAKKEQPPVMPPGSTTHPAGTAGIPEKPEGGKGKDQKRLFGVAGGEKAWLTKAEAEKRGLFWLDDEKKVNTR